MRYEEDPILRDIASLNRARTSPEWDRRVRARCHALVSKISAEAPQPETPGYRRLGFADALTLALLCAYLTAILGTAARLSGLI